MKKKSQMEIMGLAIVFILVILGLLFVVRFVMLSKPADYRSSYIPEQLASNTLNTFLNTNSKDCSGLLLKELIRDCGEGQSISCENGQMSCSYVETVADYILNNTLDIWKYDYYFTTYLRDDEDNPIIELGDYCAGDKQTERFPITSDVGAIYVELEICG